MARSPKLTDIQLVLLTTAAQRADGYLLPPAASIAAQEDGIRKAIPPLIKRTFVEEKEVTDVQQGWRQEGETYFGVTITAAGLAMVGAEMPSDVEVPEAEPVSIAKPASKIARVLQLLQRPEGASLVQMVDATGWLPHTTRAALTGLRKKGHAIAKESRDGVTVYSVAAAV